MPWRRNFKRHWAIQTSIHCHLSTATREKDRFFCLATRGKSINPVHKLLKYRLWNRLPGQCKSNFRVLVFPLCTWRLLISYFIPHNLFQNLHFNMQTPGFSTSGLPLSVLVSCVLLIQTGLWVEARLVPHCGHSGFSELHSFTQYVCSVQTLVTSNVTKLWLVQVPQYESCD